MTPVSKALRLEIHTVLKQVDYDYQRMQYNTVVSGAMKMLNALEDFKGLDSAEGQIAAIESFRHLAARAYPATPHLTHVLWSELGYANKQGDLLDAAWPQPDPSALVQDELELMLQINGKLRGKVRVPASADKAEIERLALACEDAQKHIEGATPKKNRGRHRAAWSISWCNNSNPHASLQTPPSRAAGQRPCIRRNAGPGRAAALPCAGGRSTPSQFCTCRPPRAQSWGAACCASWPPPATTCSCCCPRKPAPMPMSPCTCWANATSAWCWPKPWPARCASCNCACTCAFSLIWQRWPRVD